MGSVSLQTLQKRTSRGASLIELLVTMGIVSLSFAVLSELAVMVTSASIKTTNKVDGLIAARTAMNRIATDVRHARGVGDAYGVGTDRFIFPAPSNPKHGALYGSTPPNGGWPAAPWAPIPMTLSSTVLILQIPVTYEDPNNANNKANGMPLMLPKDHFRSGVPPTNMENLDTVVYEVVPDTTRTGEYLLQVARFPGEQIRQVPSKAVPAINPPQTILKGLVGPKTTADGVMPSVFTYLAPLNAPTPFARVAPQSVSADAIRGVGIDLEIKNTGLPSAQGDGNEPQILGIHTETFMRANIAAEQNNTTVVPP